MLWQGTAPFLSFEIIFRFFKSNKLVLYLTISENKLVKFGPHFGNEHKGSRGFVPSLSTQLQSFCHKT